MEGTKLSVTALLFAMLAGCGDSPARPTGPERAAFQLTVGERDWWPNDNPEKEYWLTAEITIRETTGLGGNIDFLRLEGIGPGGVYEKAENGSDVIVAELGSNRVNARSSWSDTVGWEWNLPNAEGYQITVQLTDDNGHVVSLVSRDEGYPE